MVKTTLTVIAVMVIATWFWMLILMIGVYVHAS